MAAFSVKVGGHRFDVPLHMIGILDRTTPWGQGIEQQEMAFARQVVDAFGTTERMHEILSAAAVRRIQEAA